MAARSKIGLSGIQFEPGKPKLTRQGRSKTKLSATARNGRKKRYRGQGK